MRSDKLVVAWVDHDNKFLSEVVDGVGSLRMYDMMEPLSNQVSLKPVFVDIGERLHERALETIKAECGRPDVVLVDLSFGTHLSMDEVYEGQGLAVYLRKNLHGCAVGVYTKQVLDAAQIASITASQFAVLLVNVRTLFEAAPTRIGGEKWLGLFRSMLGLELPGTQALPRIFGRTPPHTNVRWVDGHPLHRSPSFAMAALDVTAIALQWLPQRPLNISISELGGGFSGSFIVKAEIEGSPKPFVIKIDESPERIDREVEGYKHVVARVPQDYFLAPILFDQPNAPRLAADWWAGFPMEYEGEAKPLISHSGREPALLAGVFRRIWSECLGKLYGEPQPREVSVADIVSSESRHAANKAWERLERYSERISSLNGGLRRAVERGMSVLKDAPGSIATDGASIVVPWVSSIHGDLNCRNVLLDATTGVFKIVDFPRVGNPGCLAIDFAKSEAETILTMMDWATGLDCEFSRLEVWGSMTAVLSSGFGAASSGAGPADVETSGKMVPIREIRSAFVSLHGGIGNAADAYRLYLIAALLPYMAYPEVTPAKRVLTLLWIGQLSEASWTG